MMQFEEAGDTFDQYLHECAASVDKMMSWSKREVLKTIDSLVLEEESHRIDTIATRASHILGDSLAISFYLRVHRDLNATSSC